MPSISAPHVVTTLYEGFRQSKVNRIEYGLRDTSFIYYRWYYLLISKKLEFLSIKEDIRKA